MACAASTEENELDPARPYRLSPSVSLRPEPFGALVYDFATRRLSFLKTTVLVGVVRQLAEQPDVDSALTAAGVPGDERARYLGALRDLLRAGTIRPRQ